MALTQTTKLTKADAFNFFCEFNQLHRRRATMAFIKTHFTSKRFANETLNRLSQSVGSCLLIL